MEPDFDFAKLYHDSGLTVQELTRLFGVTSTTVNNWIAGTTPHVLHRHRVERIAQEVREAIDDGRLPMAAPKYARGNARQEELESVFPHLS